MALSKEQVYRSFVKGLITEASPLTYPENSSLDEDNFVLNRDGSRERRLGLDYESGYSLKATGLGSQPVIDSSRQSFHLWNTSSGSSSNVIGVIRISNRLWFIDLKSSSPSASFFNSGNSITVTGLETAEDLEAASINGDLVLVSKALSKPVVLSFNLATPPLSSTISQAIIDIKVRDIWGVDDGLEVDDRPTTLSALHTYNLRNQGWNKNISTDNSKEAILNYEEDTDRYPSNADNWVLGRNTNPSSDNFEKFQGSRMNRNSIGNSPAPRGALIIDAFNRGSSRTTEANKAGQNKGTTVFVSDVSGLPTDREDGKISSIASFAGRLFYSGIHSNIIGPDAESPNYSNYVFFTQVVTNNTKLGSCYQEADPTSATINDLIDSDGGTVAIPECTQIIKIAAAQGSLLIFGDNGVWELYGDTNGFVATSFQVAKVSTNGIYSPTGVVSVGNGFVYWSKAGIYALQPDPGSGRFAATNISLSTIQEFYLSIPETQRVNIKSFYDERQNRCRWLYNDTAPSGRSVNTYNKELVYDLTLQAFYKNSLSSLVSNSPYVVDYVQVPGLSSTEQETEVIAGTDFVLKGTDQVIIPETVSISKNSQFAFLTLVGTSFTLSKYRSSTYTDWQTAGAGTGANYTSYLITGYELFGDLMRNKAAPYVMFFFNRTEDGYQAAAGGGFELKNQSSCKVQAQWNWANSDGSGRWGSEFQAYRLVFPYTPTGVNDPFDYGESVIVTKHKLRGNGRCLSLKISSDQGKAMHLLGWGITANATDKV